MGDLRRARSGSKICVVKLKLPGRRSLATLFGVIEGRQHAFLKIVFLMHILMTHLAIFWYLKRKASHRSGCVAITCKPTDSQGFARRAYAPIYARGNLLRFGAHILAAFTGALCVGSFAVQKFG
jgi:hypothetical protein